MSTSTARDLRQQLADLVSAYDASVVSGPAAVRDVAEFARIEKLAAAGRMLAAGRVEETQAWIGSGHRSPQDWLAGEAGTSVADAAGVLETSKHLAGLPATADAVRAGDLSAGQARAVAGAAVADPGAEGELLATARRETFKGLRDAADRVKAAATDDASRQARIRARRSVRSRIDAEGAHHLTVYGPAIDGVRLAERLRPLEEQVFRDARRAARVTGDRPTFENRSYDALMELLGITEPATTTTADCPTHGTGASGHPGGAGAPSNRTGHATTSDDATGDTGDDATGEAGDPGDPGDADGGGHEPSLFSTGDDGPADRPVPTPTDETAHRRDGVAGNDANVHPGACTCGAASGDPPPQPRRVPLGANTKIIVRIDHSALQRGHAVAGETVEVVGVGPVPVTTVHDLMHDAFLAAVITRGHDVVNVAHLGRSVNAHQRTALEAVRLQCSNIACNATIGTEIDHRVPWNEHPETRLDNQDPLCRADHDRKTHHHWTLEPGTGRRRFLPPHHPDHPTRQHTTDPRDRTSDPRDRTSDPPTRVPPTRGGPTRTAPP